MISFFYSLFIHSLIHSGAVLEHEPPGTVVMSVSAIDGDGTYPNNRYCMSKKFGPIVIAYLSNIWTGLLDTL